MSKDFPSSSSSYTTSPPSVQDTSTSAVGGSVTPTTTTAATLQRKRKLSSDNQEQGSCPADQPHNDGGGDSSCSLLDSLPAGYRFLPTDEELLHFFLLKKIKNEPLPGNKISDADIYQDRPELLTEKYPQANEDEWYFFSPMRPNRKAGDGYWEATEPEEGIYENGVKTGLKKTFVYYVGKEPNGEKTDWVMHEFVLIGYMKLDDYVLCKIFKEGKGGGEEEEEEEEEWEEEEEEEESDDDTEELWDQEAPPTNARVENHAFSFQNLNIR